MINWQNFIVSSIMFDWVWQSNYCCSNRSDFWTFDWISLIFWSIVVLHKTQSANRCFSKIFETIFLPFLSLCFQIHWKLPFPNFFFHPELFKVLFFFFSSSIHCCGKKFIYLLCYFNLNQFKARHWLPFAWSWVPQRYRKQRVSRK